MRKIHPLWGIVPLSLILPYLIPLSSDHTMPVLPYPDSRFFTTSDDVRIHYRLAIPTAVKGKVLFVHGLAGSTFSFRNNVDDLVNQGYEVLRVDLPAFGYSDRRGGLVHSQVNRARWLWELLDKIDRDTNDSQAWTLAGHSMGASTILAMSNQKHDHVSALVMIDGAVTQDTPRIPHLFDTPLGRWMKVYLRYGAIKRSKVKEFLNSAYAKEADDEAIDGYLAPLLIDKTSSALVDFIKTAKNVTIEEWKNPEIPLLLTWGEKDTWVKPSSIDRIRQVARDVQVEIFQGAGHCPHATDPSFNAILITFLNYRSR